MGDEILLTGSERYLTNFSFEFWCTNTANPFAFAGPVEARVRFYQNNGTNFNGYASPGTNFYDSGWFALAPTERSTVVFTLGNDFPWLGLFLPVISNMTWSVQFQGMGATDLVGVDIYFNGGLSSNWSTILGSATVNTWTLPIDPANGSVFCRLIYP